MQKKDYHQIIYQNTGFYVNNRIYKNNVNIKPDNIDYIKTNYN